MKAGVDEKCFTGYEQAFWRATVSLKLQGRTLTSLDLIQQANSTIPADYWQEIQQIWDNPPDLDPLGFITALKEASTSRRVEKVLGTTQKLLSTNPHGITKWLPQAVSAFQKVMEEGQTYNPDPRHIYYNSSTLDPFASTGFTVLDELFLGGYRYGDFILIYGLTKRGKSTVIYSLIAKAIMSGLPCAFIRGERPESEVVRQILKAICGDVVSHAELENKEFDVEHLPDNPRALAKSEALLAMSECLTLHPLESGTIEEAAQIIAIYKPVLLFVDPLERMVMGTFKGEAWKSGQAAAQGWLDLASSHKHPCAVVGSLQLSPSQEEEWKSERNLGTIKGYGTNANTMKSTLAMVVDRGYGVLMYRTRAGGRVSLPFDLPYSESRECYLNGDE
jgi:hypothetical protein